MMENLTMVFKYQMKEIFNAMYEVMIPRIDGFKAVLKIVAAKFPTWNRSVGIGEQYSLQGLAALVPHATIFRFGGPVKTGIISGVMYPEIAENSLAAVIREAVGNKYEVEPSIPTHIASISYGLENIGRLKRYHYPHITPAGNLVEARPEPYYDKVNSDMSLVDGYIVVTPNGKPSVISWLKDHEWIPNVETDAVFFAKAGKYLNHQGAMIGEVKVSISDTLFKGDGVSYISLSTLRGMKSNIVQLLEDTTDGPMNKLLTKVMDIIDDDVTAVIKGWIAGSFAFGKGMIHVLTDNIFTAQFPNVSLDTMMVDGNFVKLVDYNADASAKLFVHDIVDYSYSNKITWAMVERLGASVDALYAFTESLDHQLNRDTLIVESEGLQAILAKISKDEQELGTAMDGNVRHDTIVNLRKTLLKRFTHIKGSGFTGYLLPTLPQFKESKEYIVYLNICHKGKVDTNGILTRWPLQGPFGGKRVFVEFVPWVPVNAMSVSKTLMNLIESNMAGDTDGDRLVLINKHQRPKGLTKAVSLLVTKDVVAPNTKKANTISKVPDSMDRAAVLARTYIAQSLVASADMMITSHIINALSIGLDVDVIAEDLVVPVTLQQASLDGIKHLGENLPAFKLPKGIPLVRFMRSKDDEISIENLNMFRSNSKHISQYAVRLMETIYKYSEVNNLPITGDGDVTQDMSDMIKKFTNILLHYSKNEGMSVSSMVFGAGLSLRNELIKQLIDKWITTEDKTPQELADLVIGNIKAAELIANLYDGVEVHYPTQLKYWEGGLEE